MINRSYWEDISFFREPDYLIIGAGFVGLYTAYFLKKARPDADVVVVERGPFSNGASTKMPVLPVLEVLRKYGVMWLRMAAKGCGYRENEI